MTTKVTAGAKSFGSFFSGVANKAGAKIKETVKDNVSYVHENSFAALSEKFLRLFSRFLERSTKNRSNSSKNSLARVVMLAVAHGLDMVRMKIRLRKKLSVSQE